MTRYGPMALMLALCAISCAEKKDEESNNSEAGIISSSEKDETGTATAMEIDATSRTDWVGLDIDSASFIGATELPNQAGWDLAFKRTSIKMNGIEVQMQIVDQDFAALELAPKDGYQGDQPSTTPDAAETEGLAFHTEPGWYAYDINTHVVSSRGLVYVIKSSEGRYFKLKLLDYYNAARLPAYINLEFQELKGVEP